MKDDTRIVSTEHGTELDFVDDLWGTLWAYSDDPYGHIRGVVRAKSIEAAYKLVIDDLLPAIPLSEVPEAYGFKTSQELDAAYAKAKKDPATEYPELIEGYQHQDGSLTGIVSVGHSEQLFKLTPKNWKASKLQIKIRRRDW